MTMKYICMLLFAFLLIIHVSHGNKVDEKAANDVLKSDTRNLACDITTSSVIRSPNIVTTNDKTCGELIGQPVDQSREDFRLECQRWLGQANTPEIVNDYFIDYCATSGSTTTYRADICCPGSPTAQRCFQCTNVTSDYDCVYSADVVSCTSGQVCQTTLDFYDPHPSTKKYISKFCAASTTCSTDQTENSATCKRWIRDPECNYCCTDNWCNAESPSTSCGSMCYIAENACTSNPCYNGGTCNLYSNDTWSYFCDCRPGFSGDRCQTNPCSTWRPCQNSGYCLNNGTDYKCYCKQGWGGRNCTEAYSMCSGSPNYCENGGSCIDHGSYGLRCSCPTGFVGSRCEVATLVCSEPGSLYQQTSIYQRYMLNDNCTNRVLYERQYGLSDSYNKDRCRSQMQQPGKPQFEDNVHGYVPYLESASVWKCEKGEEYGWYSEEACCPTCYSMPCENNAWCTQKSNHDYICQCRFGWDGRNCQIRNQYCVISGDPHYTTFDGEVIHYQGECLYQLAASDSSFPPWETFKVLGRNKRRPGLQTVSYLNYLEIEVFGHVVELGQDRKVWIDGIPVKPEIDYGYMKVLFNGLYVRLETNFSLVVEFDGDSTGIIKLPSIYEGQNEGMCGDFNGDPMNDLRTREGEDVHNVTNHYSLIGESWKIHMDGNPSCRVEVEDVDVVCDPADEAIVTGNNYCGMIKDTSGIFSACIANPKIREENDFDSCVYDMCAFSSDPEEMQYSFCKSMEAFALKCENEGIIVDWRTTTNCAVTCPNGTVYQSSAPACHATCGNPDSPEQCHLPNREGCVCPDTMVMDDGQCVDAQNCGCTEQRDGIQIQWQIGESWLSADCQTNNTCVECTSCTRPVGEIIARSYSCGTGEECLPQDDGSGQCQYDCSACSCTDANGTIWQIGESWLSADCQTNSTCVECTSCTRPVGEIIARSYSCGTGEECLPQGDGSGQCQYDCSTCSCTDANGTIWQIGESWLSADCQTNNTCVECTSCTRPVGEIIARSYSCGTGEECLPQGDGSGQCQYDCSACSCTDAKGTIWQIGESWLSADCQTNNTCVECTSCPHPVGEIIARSYSCGTGEECVPHGDGSGQCQYGCSTCSCSDADGIIWQIGESKLNSDCSEQTICQACMTCTPAAGILAKQPHSCADNQMCAASGLIGQCQDAGCSTCSCTDADSIIWEIGESKLNSDCSEQTLCQACMTCVPAVGRLEKQPHSCGDNQMCATSGLIGQCQDMSAAMLVKWDRLLLFGTMVASSVMMLATRP